jgi:PAS domain S-box-containing protein
VISEEEAAWLLRFESGLPGGTESLLITDGVQPDHPILFASRGFLLLTGYETAEILGRNCRFLQGPDTDPQTIEAIRTAVSQRRRFDGDILNYRKDGTPFWNGLSVAPLASVEPGTLFVGLQSDVSFRHTL